MDGRGLFIVTKRKLSECITPEVKLKKYLGY